ncbi:hypothetical protein BDQ17DRAFT_1513575 [Cyathus striatus]|nr:hypothetical protein BDQ17DRAFT_1513575 [Cyathus striatus]
MRLIYFPVELLHEIVKHTSVSSLPQLRLACKTFNDVVAPCMFRHAHIRYSSLSLDKFLDILHAFAVGEHPSVTHAKMLTVHDLGPEPNRFGEGTEERRRYDLEVLDPYEARLESIQTRIQVALLSCRNVNTVIWDIARGSTLGWGRDSVLFGLENMSSLTSFTLNALLRHDNSLPISSLPPLQLSQTTTMEFVACHIYWQSPPEPFVISNSRYTVRMTQRLKSLNFTEIYTCDTDEQSELITLEDYLDALGSHASSLESLTILPEHEGNWCFGKRGPYDPSHAVICNALTMFMRSIPMNKSTLMSDPMDRWIPRNINSQSEICKVIVIIISCKLSITILFDL